MSRYVKYILVFFLSPFFVPQFPWLWDLIWAIWARHWLAMNIAWKHMSLYSIQGPCTPNWVQLCWDVWWYMESLLTGVRYLYISIIDVYHHAHINLQTPVYTNAIFRFYASVYWTWHIVKRGRTSRPISRSSVSMYYTSSYLICPTACFLRVLFQGSPADVSAPTLFG